MSSAGGPGRRLRLEADFQCSPLWVEDPEQPELNATPEDLGLGPALAADLWAWAAGYDETLDQDYPPWSGFPSIAAAADWVAEGTSLHGRLVIELSLRGWTVTYQAGSPDQLVRAPGAGRPPPH